MEPCAVCLWRQWWRVEEKEGIIGVWNWSDALPVASGYSNSRPGRGSRGTVASLFIPLVPIESGSVDRRDYARWSGLPGITSSPTWLRRVIIKMRLWWITFAHCREVDLCLDPFANKGASNLEGSSLCLLCKLGRVSCAPVRKRKEKNPQYEKLFLLVLNLKAAIRLNFLLLCFTPLLFAVWGKVFQTCKWNMRRGPPTPLFLKGELFKVCFKHKNKCLLFPWCDCRGSSFPFVIFFLKAFPFRPFPFFLCHFLFFNLDCKIPAVTLTEKCV